MKNPFARKSIPHPDGLDSTYYIPGIVFDGGAEHLAYINTRPHPLLTQYGGFVPQRQIQMKSPQLIYQYNALPVTTLLAGVVPGQLNQQALLQQGQLGTGINSTLVETTLFGAVQS